MHLTTAQNKLQILAKYLSIESLAANLLIDLKMSDTAATKTDDANGSDTSSPDVPTPTSFTCIVNVTDGVENTIEAFFLEIQTTDIDDEKLSDLRALIVKTTRCVEM